MLGCLIGNLVSCANLFFFERQLLELVHNLSSTWKLTLQWGLGYEEILNTTVLTGKTTTTTTNICDFRRPNIQRMKCLCFVYNVICDTYTCWVKPPPPPPQQQQQQFVKDQIFWQKNFKKISQKYRAKFISASYPRFSAPDIRLQTGIL